MPGMPAGRRLAFMTRAAALLAAALALAGAAAGCGLGGSERVGGERAAKPRVLTMLNPFTSSEELTDFADEVKRLSDGALRIRIIPAGHAGRPDFEAATIRDVLHGRGRPRHGSQPRMGRVRRPQPARPARPAADRQLPAPGARTEERSRRSDARGAATPGPRGNRDPARRHPPPDRPSAPSRGSPRLQRTDDRRPPITRRRCQHASARRPPGSAPCRGAQPWRASTASSTSSAGSTPTAWTSTART